MRAASGRTDRKGSGALFGVQSGSAAAAAAVGSNAPTLAHAEKVSLSAEDESERDSKVSHRRRHVFVRSVRLETLGA